MVSTLDMQCIICVYIESQSFEGGTLNVGAQNLLDYGCEPEVWRLRLRCGTWPA